MIKQAKYVESGDTIRTPAGDEMTVAEVRQTDRGVTLLFDNYPSVLLSASEPVEYTAPQWPRRGQLMVVGPLSGTLKYVGTWYGVCGPFPGAENIPK